MVEDEKYENTLKNIYKLLNKGGIFLFSENFIHSKEITSKHVKFRKLNKIEYYLNKEGFKIIDRMPMFYLMSQPADSNSIFFKIFFRFLSLLVRFEILGKIIGRTLYPIESCLVLNKKESPCIELMICVKEK